MVFNHRCQINTNNRTFDSECDSNKHGEIINDQNQALTFQQFKNHIDAVISLWFVFILRPQLK